MKRFDMIQKGEGYPTEMVECADGPFVLFDEVESRESLAVSAAVMATELLRELLADSIVMSWIKAHDKHKGTMYEQRMRSLVDGSPKAEAKDGGAKG